MCKKKENEGWQEREKSKGQKADSQDINKRPIWIFY